MPGKMSSPQPTVGPLAKLKKSLAAAGFSVCFPVQLLALLPQERKIDKCGRHCIGGVGVRDLIALVLLATAVEAGAFVYLRLNKQPIGPMQTFATVGNTSVSEAKPAKVSHPRAARKPDQHGDVAIDSSAPVAKSEVIIYAEDESWNRYDKRQRLTSGDASNHPFPTESDFSRGMPRSQILRSLARRI